MENWKVTVGDSVVSVADGTTLQALAKQFEERYTEDIILAFVDNKLCELGRPIVKDCTVRFITTAERIGNQTYRRTASFILLKAVQDVLGKDGFDKVKTMYSVSKGLYCEITGCKEPLNDDLLARIRTEMQRLVDADIVIEKETVKTDEAVSRFKKQGMADKERLFKYRRVSQANIYRLEDYENYFYGYMAYSTGAIKYFALYQYGDGFVLQMPVKESPKVVPPFEPQEKLFHVLKQADEWGRKLDVETVGALNDVIARGEIEDLILVSEALQEKYIADIAERIAREEKQIVLIAGPSSSGKTSLSHRLSIQLRAQGLHPHPIAMDNYFVNRELTPRDADGKYDFECLEALDVRQFNADMNALLMGKEVAMPTFNFQIGKREYKGNTLQIGEGDVLVIEGIHGLNPKLSESLPEESKFRIYISALTQLNVDEHNRIATTDGRLIRRIIRDARTRGNTAQMTISMWNSVRRGEEQNIFPYQENADVMFNSALTYELCVLKQHIEPLLFAIPTDAEEYPEAKRLLKFLDYFLNISGEKIPNNSILREFIGGSCFKV